MNTPVAGRELLRVLKRSAGLPGPQLCLKVGAPAIAWLRPVATEPERQDPLDLERLSEWRNANVGAFLTEFQATPARTSAWLANDISGNDTRALFMIDDASGQTVGYMGLAYINWDGSYGEADSIVKGIPTEKGLAALAIDSLIQWARGSLGLKTIGVRVRSDNKALAFYEKVGFVELRRVPLVRTEHDGQVNWREHHDGAPSSLSLVHMRYNP